MFKKILSYWPSTCILCDNQGLENLDLCQFCFDGMTKNNNACSQCAIPYPKNQPRTQPCKQCQTIPSQINRIHAPFLHEGSIRFLIAGLKFNHQYKNARLLGRLLANSLISERFPDCIVPVPLHKKRYQQRGFNQSIEIAKTVSQQLAIPLETDWCYRRKNTPHQVGLSSKARKNNLKNAFAIHKNKAYTHIALLDDVMTTGSTLSEMVAVFKKAGVRTIDCWVCARAYR
jgi:ComF family protein